MLIVRVELHSAITGQVTEIARMEICNDGTALNSQVGNYDVRTLRGRDSATLNKRTIQRKGKVLNYRRQALHVWNLVQLSLTRMGYNNTRTDAND